jgi:hypothetical protein
MLDIPVVRWLGYGLAVSLMAGPLLTWWQPTASAEAMLALPDSVVQLAAVKPERSSRLLTSIYDELAKTEDVQQVLLLQAVPGDVPIVIANTEDSSDDEEPTHWPSPWPAVNAALASGRLTEQVTVRGHSAGFDYWHTLVPVDETQSRILLVNRAVPATSWSLHRGVVLLAGLSLLIALLSTHE